MLQCIGVGPSLLKTYQVKKDQCQHDKRCKTTFNPQLCMEKMEGKSGDKASFSQSRGFHCHGSSLLSWGREEWNINKGSLPHVVRGAAPGLVHLPPRWIQWKQGEGGVERQQWQNRERGFTDVHGWRWRGLLALDGGPENIKTYRLSVFLYQGICKIVTCSKHLPWQILASKKLLLELSLGIVSETFLN